MVFHTYRYCDFKKVEYNPMKSGGYFRVADTILVSFSDVMIKARRMLRPGFLRLN